MAVKTSTADEDGLDSVAFPFDFPDELSLSAVDVTDGVPKLRFVSSPRVPTITEEDIAVCARLSQEKTRPEFYYVDFPPGHPFRGRKYKDYRPSYLRGTSVGELLAEADWHMKCLNVGIKSDETKTKCMSWAENSQLGGLATSECFPSMASGGSIIMKCKSVEVDETEEEMSFGDPKMTISAKHQPSYSDYLTEKFDAIAFHDEPLFLKVKELIKLILAMEWFQKKGVKFSMEWINEHLNHSRMSAQQVIAVKRPKLTQKIVDHVLKQLQLINTAILAAVPAIRLPSPWSALQPAIRTTTSITTTVTDRTFQIKHVSKTDFLAIISKETTLTISIDDFDMLYQGMDANSPLIYCDENGKLCLAVPNVDSWSKLFAETVPVPCKALLASDGKSVKIVIVSGGVSTLSIPVTYALAQTAKASAQEIYTYASSRKTCKRLGLSTSKVVIHEPSVRGASSNASGQQQPAYTTHPRHGNRESVDHEQQQLSIKFSINRQSTVNGRPGVTTTSHGSTTIPVENEYSIFYDGVKEHVT